MRRIVVLLGCLFALLWAGNARWQSDPVATDRWNAIWESPENAALRAEGRACLERNDFVGAIAVYRRGAAGARSRGDQVSEGRFLLNEASSHLALGRAREALALYQAAGKAVAASGDRVMEQVLELSLANLYLSFGDLRAAAAALERARIEERRLPPERRLSVLLVSGRLAMRQRGLAAALPLFREALAAGQMADAGGRGVSREAEVWNLLGSEARRLGDLDLAEEGAAQAWRLRVLRGDPRLAESYPLIGLVAAARGQIERGRMWIGRAIGASGRQRVLQPWYLQYEYARLAEAAGDPAAALASYRRAIEGARQWRAGVMPADLFRTRAEAELSDLFDGYLRVSAALPEQMAPAAERFAVLQESHAWSLQVHLEESAAISRRLPEEYFAELVEERSGTPDARRRLRLLEKELAAGLPLPSVADAAAAEERLEPGEAVLTYHTGEPFSELWLLTADGIERTELAGRARLGEAVAVFRRAIEAGAPEGEMLGERLLHELLGRLRERALGFPRWRLILDDRLFDTPFAALSVKPGEFLIDRHTLLQVPSLRLPIRRKPLSGSFLGLADPLFNRADPRWPAEWGPTALQWRGWLIAAPGAELPRLPATHAETLQSGRIWGAAELLTGPQVTARQLQSALRRHPVVLHLATHTVPQAGDGASEEAALALSIDGEGHPEMLGPREILALSEVPPLVVLSGCRTGGGIEVGGAGVVGLTRAWLAAGADDVIATQWPTIDDAGPFFPGFYARLSAGGAAGRFRVAAALREAQLACRRQGGFRAAPRYWATYFASGKG